MPDLENPLLDARIPSHILYRQSYSHLCDKIRYHGNRGQSEINLNATVRYSDHDFLKRVGYIGNQKSFCVFWMS